MIDVEAAAKLLDFGARIGAGQRATEQLHGAVALHNLLEEQKVAYLADEVGMGKTYVALGALALFRHFHPRFRVLVIAPRGNIQMKWMKECGNFAANNFRFADLRNRTLDRRPARPLVACENLRELVHEVGVNRERDFFLRLTSFSLPLSLNEGSEDGSARSWKETLRDSLGWLDRSLFDLRDKAGFKDNIAKALCCALPVFDLVIVDEGHNLKHGYGESVASRNRVLGLAMGRAGDAVDTAAFPGYGPRAKRVLFLSATPVEDSYRQLWNQLDLFGMGRKFLGLKDPELGEDEKKEIARKFLIRRVTAIEAGGSRMTKNLYRREWRSGGVATHDEPIRVTDPKQRLIVALVQKKVAEVLRHEKFGSNFQIGMLASFESFLETAKLKRSDEETGNFDDSDQTQDDLEKEGIDVADLNRLAASFRKRFGTSLPHPKMDALVETLSSSWKTGEKALVFVRRVASVKEIKAKLDEQYDQWLMDRLSRELPAAVRRDLERIFRDYRVLKSQRAARTEVFRKSGAEDEEDTGGQDTFFAWFFRGDGPGGVISGANVQQRFIKRGTVYSTFFEDNHVAALLDCRPSEVPERLEAYLGLDGDALAARLRKASRGFIGKAQKVARGERFEAIQAAAMEMLMQAPGPLQPRARVMWHQRYEASRQRTPAKEGVDPGQWLTHRTFFTELRQRESLRERIWKRPEMSDFLAAFRESELRAQLLAGAARLGHPLIDLYILTIRRLGSLALRTQEAGEDDADSGTGFISEYLDHLEQQMNTAPGKRDLGAYDEFASLSEHFDLVLDVNEPEARTKALGEMAVRFGKLLRQQQPIGGMAGQVNQTLVRQFRMPGYPFVLISTDLLQEGEDLHSFCSTIHHYGISWTPSSMEQRIGRVDRVRSQTERRLTQAGRGPITEAEKTQVHFPYLQDTVEVLQVRKVLERMNTFLRLMHEGLLLAENHEKTIDTRQEFLRGLKPIPRITEPLKSAFEIPPALLSGSIKELAVNPGLAEAFGKRFLDLANHGKGEIEWEEEKEPSKLLGTLTLGTRVQPFSLLLKSVDARALIRCISPIGRIQPEEFQEEIRASLAKLPAHIGAIRTRENRTYDLTVEGDVLLAADASTDFPRVRMLIHKIARQADALEHIHLRGQDQNLDVFRVDLKSEGGHVH